MKNIVYLFLALKALTATGQDYFPLQQYDFDSSFKIIGICSQLDDKNVNQGWTFIINSLDKLKTAKVLFKHGKEFDEPVYSDEDLQVNLVKDKEVINIYYVSPKFKYISYHPTDTSHGIFPFDIQPLYQLADVKGVNYRYKDYTFKSEEEFKKFLSVNKPKKEFLCWEDVSEELSGKFTVIIPISNKIQVFKDGWALIEEELNRITSNKKDYLMSFNLTNSTKTAFYYEVNTSKTLYQKFNLTGYPKSSWVKNLIEISTVWLK